MMRLSLKFLPTLALTGLALLSATPAMAKGEVACPLRDAPFSVDSPLIDILLSPAARAEMDRALPGLLDGFPPFFTSTTPPSFAAIITLKEAAGFRERLGPQPHAPADTKPPADMQALNRSLAAVPVTAADRIARCARYDAAPVSLSAPAGKPRVLLFEKINGFRDSPSVDGAHAAITAMAARGGWSLTITDKGAAFTPANLRQFDIVLWNNISGDVLTVPQRRAFRRYMEQGGGYIGLHGSAGDPVYFWDWYVDTLLGARFAGHPMNPQFQTARVRIDDAGHPIASGLPAQWDMNDEWYSFKTNPRASGSRIIATLDESTYNPVGWPGQNLIMGDHPIAWTRCVGPIGQVQGRVFYSAIGHRPERYADPLYVQMLESAVTWVGAGRTAKTCSNGN